VATRIVEVETAVGPVQPVIGWNVIVAIERVEHSLRPA
jgi:hypothetical protein